MPLKTWGALIRVPTCRGLTLTSHLSSLRSRFVCLVLPGFIGGLPANLRGGCLWEGPPARIWVRGTCGGRGKTVSYTLAPVPPPRKRRESCTPGGAVLLPGVPHPRACGPPPGNGSTQPFQRIRRKGDPKPGRGRPLPSVVTGIVVAGLHAPHVTDRPSPGGPLRSGHLTFTARKNRRGSLNARSHL